jgi:hypothetical protein
VAATALISTGVAAWLLVFVEESRCNVENLAALTVLALLLTLVPTGVAIVGRAPWWLGASCTGLALLLLLAVFRPGGLYGCSYSIVG